MSGLEELLSLERNFIGFLNGSFMKRGELADTSDEDECIGVDWETCGYELNPLYEEDELSDVRDLLLYEDETVQGSVMYVYRHPLERVRNTEFFEKSDATLERYLVDHGYLHYRTTVDEEDDVLTKSEFQVIISKCVGLKERLLSVARSKIGYKKNTTKRLYLSDLGYGVNKRVGDGEEGDRSEIALSREEMSRLVKRKACGDLVTNWWRTARITQLYK